MVAPASITIPKPTAWPALSTRLQVLYRYTVKLCASSPSSPPAQSRSVQARSTAQWLRAPSTLLIASRSPGTASLGVCCNVRSQASLPRCHSKSRMRDEFAAAMTSNVGVAPAPCYLIPASAVPHTKRRRSLILPSTDIMAKAKKPYYTLSPVASHPPACPRVAWGCAAAH